MGENIMLALCLVVAIACFVLSARGACRTQAALAMAGESDAIINMFAWVDRVVFRPAPSSRLPKPRE